MLLNKETSIAANPMSNYVRRSKFKRPKEVLTTFSNFELTPNYIEEILPGDTVNMQMTSLIRMNTPIAPVMDTAFADQYFFFVPKRILWSNFKYFMGEESNSYWSNVGEKTMPQIFPPTGGYSVGSMADHLGVVPGIDGSSVDALPFRAVAMIWNEWFRDEQTTQPISFNTGDSTVYATGGKTWDDYVNYGAEGEIMLRVARFHDVFGSGLREPQAGDPSIVPITASGYPYVVTTNDWSDNPMFTKMLKPDEDNVVRGALLGTVNTTTEKVTNGVGISTASSHGLVSIGGANNDDGVFVNTTAGSGSYSNNEIVPVNFVVDMESGSGVGISITDIRQAAAVQHVLEVINRGSRFVEIIKNAFGTTVPDARLQRPELLGFKRFPISMSEINQTSSTDAVSPLGTPGANSKTLNSSDMFTASFCEPGFLIGLVCVRNVATYAQGIKRFWRKKDRYDYYWPQLNGLSNSAIWNSEIYWQSDSVVDDDGEVVNDNPFAFAECWYEYINDVNECHGYMRPQVNQSLAVWNYADNYSSLPTLSTGWLYPDGSNIRRTLAVQTMPDFRGDFYFNPTYVRPMPIYNVPGIGRL